MKLYQQIAVSLAELKAITTSTPTAKAFRQWLVSKGGSCTPKGDVLIRGKQIEFTKVDARRVRLTLKEVLP